MKWSASGEALAVVQDGETERDAIRLDGTLLNAAQR